MRVLLLTMASPTKDLGGPGKFVPMLFEAVTHIQTTINVASFCAGKIYNDMAQIVYKPPTSSRWNTKAKELAKQAIFPLYFPGRLWQIVRVTPKTYGYKRHLFRYTQRHNVDVFHAHDFESALLITSLASKMNKPLILTNHFKGSLYKEAIAPVLPYFRTKRWEKFYLNREREAIISSDVLTFPSYSARELLIQDFPELAGIIIQKSHIIYTGIPDYAAKTPFIATYDSKTSLVLNVSNHIPDKGIDISLHIFSRLLKKLRNDLILVNFGQIGPETRKLREMSAKLGLPRSKVYFMGVRPHSEVLEALQSAFVVLHTPRKTVFDLFLLECMAFGKPIIATRTRGNEEALGEDYSLYISLNNFELSDTQVDLLVSSYEAIGRSLRKRFLEKFTIEKMATNYLLLWERVGTSAGE